MHGMHPFKCVHHLTTQGVGGGTVADIATFAFADLLTAWGKKKNVVVSDPAAAYKTGARLIHPPVEDTRAELGRQVRNITAVELPANEVYGRINWISAFGSR